MSSRRLLCALIAALFSMMTVGAAEAQLWKPKKKAAVTAKKPTVKKAARAKKPTRKKKSASSVVKFGPPKERAPVVEIERDTEVEPDDEVDDNPRISVYDGDRDE